MSSFTAKDGDGTNFEVAAGFDSGNGVYYPQSMPATDRPLISQRVDSLGTGAGTTNMIGNYSGGATDFWTEPPAGEIWHLTRFIGLIEYSGSLRPERYGNAALTNGVKLVWEANSVETDFTAQGNITHLADWAGFTGHAETIDFGAGNNFIIFVGDFTKGGSILKLDGDTNDKAIIRLEDDHTDLVSHRVTVQGYKMVGS